MYSIAKGAEGRFLRFKLWAERISAAAIHLYCTMSYYSSIKVKNFNFLTLQAKCKICEIFTLKARDYFTFTSLFQTVCIRKYHQIVVEEVTCESEYERVRVVTTGASVNYY